MKALKGDVNVTIQISKADILGQSFLKRGRGKGKRLDGGGAGIGEQRRSIEL